MCARYSTASPFRKLVDRFGLTVETGLLDLTPRYNLAPTQEAPVVLRRGVPVLRLMRWGLIPRWAKDPRIASRTINARAETLADRSSFGEAFGHRRCLVPADGFYEWRDAGRAGKIPVRFVRRDREPFAFAGLWDSWRSPEGRWVDTFTIVTTEPNELVSAVHDRMPAILLVDDEARWLDPETTDPASLRALLAPYPTELLESYEVSRMVSSPDYDRPECIEPARDLWNR